MNIYPLNSLPGYTTSLPFKACALDMIPLQIPTGEAIFTILDKGEFKVQLSKEDYLTILKKMQQRKMSEDIQDIVSLLVQQAEQGSLLYNLPEYQDIAVAALYKPLKRTVKIFYTKRRNDKRQEDIRRWVYSIQTFIVERLFRRNEACCSIFNCTTGIYLTHVSYYRHYFNTPNAMETSMVAMGQVFFILRSGVV